MSRLRLVPISGSGLRLIAVPLTGLRRGDWCAFKAAIGWPAAIRWRLIRLALALSLITLLVLATFLHQTHTAQLLHRRRLTWQLRMFQRIFAQNRASLRIRRRGMSRPALRQVTIPLQRPRPRHIARRGRLRESPVKLRLRWMRWLQLIGVQRSCRLVGIKRFIR